MKLKLIYARAANGVIGLNNQMPWHLPEDLAHFKRTTLGCPVLMGRKTWESIPAKFRPLPGRANLVITRQPDWQSEGSHVVHSLEEGLTLALAHCPEGKDLWVMGGAEIYAQAAPIAEEAVVALASAPADRKRRRGRGEGKDLDRRNERLIDDISLLSAYARAARGGAGGDD